MPSRALVLLGVAALALPLSAATVAPPQTHATTPTLAVSHRARALQPGEIVEVTVTADGAVERVTASGPGLPVELWRDARPGTWRGLIGIDVEQPPGDLPIAITATSRAGTTATTTYTLAITPAQFAERHLKVDPRFVTPPPAARARIEREARRLDALYATVSAGSALPPTFIAPVPQPRSSPFGVRSFFNGEPRSRHNGLDFASPAGTRIRAPAAGHVVLVDDLYYTGNTVLLDHGHGLHSLFAHLQTTSVKEGQEVAQGTHLGTVGATGRATGPHLHWTVRLRTMRVDPAALLHLYAPGPRTPATSTHARRTPIMERKHCASADGVDIVYSAAGSGDTTLLFIHGGLADRSFYDGQLTAFAGRFRVLALDLAGHGESGRNRTQWTLASLAEDVTAVADAERARRIVLLGNSLGGPVAVEAALRLEDRVIGVVGIDTFQDLAMSDRAEFVRVSSAMLRERAAAFRADFTKTLHTMVMALFHPDADPALMADVERRMARTSPEVAAALLAGFAGEDAATGARRLKVPLRAINGDLYPTDTAAIRAVTPDFDAVVMPHTGHYPMLERPADFNRHVAAVVAALEKHAHTAAGRP